MPLVDDEVRITLRLPESLRDRVSAGGKAKGRSLNSEIVAVLAERYPEPQISESKLREAIDELERITAIRGTPEDLAKLNDLKTKWVEYWYEPLDEQDDAQ